eukprot:3716236-Lingulodinium_polyedra.AAC.1
MRKSSMWTTLHSVTGVPELCCRSNLGRDILCCTPSWPRPSRESTHRVSSFLPRCVVARHLAAPFACSSRKHWSSAAAFGSALEKSEPSALPRGKQILEIIELNNTLVEHAPQKGLHRVITAGREPIGHGHEHGLIDLPTEERIPQCRMGDIPRERPEQDAGA